MLLEILNIVFGLILLSGVIGVLPAVGKHLEKAGKWLGSFQTIFGVIAIIIALLNISITSLTFWSLLLGGFILSAGLFETFSGMKKFIKTISSIQIVFGIILLFVGVVGLIRVLA